MVKFSKELEAQLIPEWKEAFVNYWQLKKHVKKIKLARKPTKPSHPEALIKWDLASSVLIDPVRSVAKKIADGLRGSIDDNDAIAEVAIQVRSENLENGQVEGEAHETELTKLFDEEHEVRSFFEALDEELNKVNQFYENREREFLERGEELDKQLQILQDLKTVLSERRRRNSSSLKANGGHEASFSRPSSPRDSDFSSESFGELLNENSMEALEEGREVATLGKNGAGHVSPVTRSSSRSKPRGKPETGMTKRIPSTATPAGAITALTSMLCDELVNSKNTGKDGTRDFSISKKKIQCAEKMIRGAFVELYKGLCLLKNYSSLNLMAFTKILKKFHKVAGRQVSTNYLKEVKNSHFHSGHCRSTYIPMLLI